jgi:hypothetical protein
MLTKKSPKVATFLICELCDYKCCKQSDYLKHCSTRKHNLLTLSEKSLTKKSPLHVCKQCGKEYNSKQGLWSHKKKCEIINNSNNDISTHEPIKNYIMQLVEQNKELKNMVIERGEQQNTKINELSQMLAEQSKQIVVQNNIQNNIQNKTINNNTQFNLNVFLQEKCKDALNMNEFLETLQINPQSVEYTGIHGYVNGITKIFMDGLNQLDTYKRPIHCTDLKRETLYIKEENKWEKDTENNTRFKQALDTVVNRNMAQVRQWEDENPRCKIPETEEYEFYFVIARQSLGGGDHVVTARNNDRILRAIAGRVYIDKKTKEIQ